MDKYNIDFYHEINDDSLRSAKEVVPIIIELINPKKVIDVGCGTGAWLSIFKQFGVENIFGIDGIWVRPEQLLIPKINFSSQDINEPITLNETYDLAVSVEVAEHISAKNAHIYIKSLTNLAPVVLFSAAIPYQGGVHHINEQWPEYWVKIFEQYDFIVIDAIRKTIWNNQKIGCWFRQNMLIFVQKDYLKNLPILENNIKRTDLNQLSLVHPEMYLPIAYNYSLIHKILQIFPSSLLSFFKKFFKNIFNH